MKHNRIWLELVTVCAVAALILALGLAMLGVSAAVALAQGPDSSNIPAEKFQAGGEQTFSGVVTDSMCGAKHNTSMDQSAARCTKMCLKKGASFALVDGDKLYKLSGGDEYLDKVAGERVKISGTLNGDTIKVMSVDGTNK
jgi:hypothetical protein